MALSAEKPHKNYLSLRTIETDPIDPSDTLLPGTGSAQFAHRSCRAEVWIFSLDFFYNFLFGSLIIVKIVGGVFNKIFRIELLEKNIYSHWLFSEILICILYYVELYIFH